MTTAWVPLATTTLTTTDGNVAFISIPAIYRDLIVVISGTTTNITNTVFYFNDDTNANYSYVDAYGDGTDDLSASVSNTTLPEVGRMSTSQSNVIAQIMDYSATDKHKTVLARSASNGDQVKMSATRWANTAAINKIEIVPTPSGRPFSIGTTLSLYGSNRL
jgi:hypothetical protein